MSQSKASLVEDVELVFSECARVNDLITTMAAQKQLSEISRDDVIFDMPHPTFNWPDGKMACSRLGYDALVRLTEAAMLRAGLKRRVEHDKARRVLAEILVRKFLKEAAPIETKFIDRAFAEAGRRCEATTEDSTHYVPCHLMHTQVPDYFHVGSIRFLNQSTFRRTVAPLIAQDRREGSQQWPKTIRDILRYYRSFGWVAEVRVIGCDSQTSEAVATQAVVSALDCLQVFFGPSHTYKMTVGGPAINYDKRGRLAVGGNDGLRCKASYGGPSSVGFSEYWIKFFSDADAEKVLNSLGVVLEVATDPALKRPLSSRFLDAARWYGEAVREKSSGAKAVKYVTAIERMVMTDEKNDITGTVSRRVACLCLEHATTENWDKWVSEATRAYAIRSKLVHGSLSASSEKVWEGIRLGSTLGRATLLNALSSIGERGFRNGAASDRQLSNYYKRLIQEVETAISSATKVAPLTPPAP